MIYRILLVDDEPYIVESISRSLLRRWNEQIDILTATTAPQAIDILSRFRVDIVISDINMPRMTGIELYEEILKRWKHCKVIFLTGHDDFGYIHKAMRGGAIDYLLKTEPSEKILDAVNQAIAIIDKEMEAAIPEKYGMPIDLVLLALQKELFTGILNKHSFNSESELHGQLKKLNIHSLNALLVFLKDDSRKENIPTENENFVEVGNVITGFLSNRFQQVLVKMDKTERVCIIWPADNDERLEEKYIFISQVMEQVQYRCQRKGISLSILINDAFTPFSCLGGEYEKLFKFMNMELNLNRQNLILRYSESLLTYNSAKKIINRINEYISANLHGDINLTRLADIVHFSPSYLSKFYKFETGTGLREYILSKRIEKALELLPKTGYKIQEIAEMVGFERTSYFAKVFKEQVGSTPQEYRNNNIF